jgi:hypothetical protein
MAIRECANCNNKGNKPKDDPCPYCIDLCHWDGDCSVCKLRTPTDPKKFCEMDDGDDGMSCCGDKLELIDELKDPQRKEKAD